jgi:calcineurin-like phosphoesterase family protein
VTTWTSVRRAAVLLLALSLAGSSSDAQPAAGGRVVAIGDIHADLNALRVALRTAGAINTSDEWVGGSLTVVQLGDLVGRSDQEREVLDFVFALQRRARQAGGTFHALIGNHEVFGGRLDNQAVGPNPFPAWEQVPGLQLEHPRLRVLPPRARARGAALMPGGPYARRLAEFPTVLAVGRTVFVHGGVTPRWARYGIERINREVRDWLLGQTPEPDAALGVDDGDRVMWTRQFSANVTSEDCALLDQSLKILGARRMIVAHTVHPEITSRCDERVWAVDVGMSRAYGGRVQVLEIVNDSRLRVLRPEGVATERTTAAQQW